MFKGRFFASVSFLLFMTLVTACGNAGKQKEELLKEGTKLMEEKNSRGAVVYFKNALEQDPNYFEARFQLAKAYYSLANFDSAEKELQKVIRQNPSLKEARIELAKVYVQKNRPDEALSEIKDLISDGSTDADAFEAAGLAEASKAEYDRAVDHMKNALSLNGQRSETELLLSKVYMAMGRQEEAKAGVDKVLAKEPGNRNALYMLAEVYGSKGDYDGAVRSLDQVLKGNPDDLQALYRKGSILLDTGRHDEAVQLSGKLIEKYPNRPEGYLIKGVAFSYKKNLDDSITLLQKASTLGASPLTLYFLGQAHYQRGQLEQATSQFQKSLDLEPSYVPPRVMLSMVLLIQGRVDDAINEAGKALETDPQNALAHNVLGSAYMAKNMHEQGIAELNKAIDLDPKLVDAHLKKGMYSLSKGRSRDAEANFRSAVEIAPEQLNSRLILVNHYIKHNDLAKAKETISKGLSGGKADAVLHTVMAEVLLRENKPGEAIKILEKAKQLNPELPAPHFALATIYSFSGASEKVVEELKAFVSKAPKDPKAMVMLASVLEATGKRDEAASYLKMASEIGTRQAYMELSNHYLGKKEFGAVIDYLDKILKTEPSNPAVLEMKGKALMTEKRFDEAIKVFEEIEKKAPKAGFALIVNTYLAMKKPEDALNKIKKELAREPGPYGGDCPHIRDNGQAGCRRVRREGCDKGQAWQPHRVHRHVHSATVIW